MSFRATWIMSIALLLALSGCGELEVDLSDEEKDGLAAYVDRGGRYEVETPAPRRSLDTEGITSLDHLSWDAIVGSYVVDGQVAYTDFGEDEDSVEILSNYLDLLANLDPSKLENEDERLAFWMNAYNALVFAEAAEAVKENPNFSTSDDNFAFFQIRRYVVDGELYSLDQLEHGVIRGDRGHPSVSDLDDAAWAAYQTRHEAIFGQGAVDPRIHVGLNCGAFSCPLLPSQAFTGKNVDDLLEQRAVLFVQDPLRGAGPDGLSMLFNWFSVDFAAGPEGSARGFIEARREDVSDVNFGAFVEYDWSLNGQ